MYITNLLGVSIFSSFTGSSVIPLPFLPRRLLGEISNTNLTNDLLGIRAVHNNISSFGQTRQN